MKSHWSLCFIIYWPPTDHLPTTCRPPTNHLPTDHLPTTYRPLTDHLPTTYQPYTDHLPTTYRPPTDHLPTTFLRCSLLTITSISYAHHLTLFIYITGINWTHTWPAPNKASCTVAQSVEHHTSIAEAMGSNPVGASEFFLGFLCNCFSYFTTAKISFTSIFDTLFLIMGSAPYMFKFQ